MKYMLLIYNCERPEPDDPDFPDALARVNAFADECRRRGVFVAGYPLRPEHTATTVSVREAELRLETKIETVKADILKWMFGTIGFQTLVLLGAILALAKALH